MDSLLAFRDEKSDSYHHGETKYEPNRSMPPVSRSKGGSAGHAEILTARVANAVSVRYF